jgi:hypothetical protein
MPEIISTTVYRLTELSGPAIEQARDWYRRSAPDDGWQEFLFEDFERICAILGIELATHPVRLYGGGTRQEPHIWYSGFCSQGDGACFEGRYAYAHGASRTIRAHAPADGELHRIADALARIQRRNFYQLDAVIRHEGRYYHEYTMAIAVERDGAAMQDMTSDAEEAVIELLRDLARWLYAQLEREYWYQLSDPVVDEAIAANDYSFTEDGARFP